MAYNNWVELMGKYRFLRAITYQELIEWYQRYYRRNDTPNNKTLLAFAFYLKKQGYIS